MALGFIGGAIYRHPEPMIDEIYFLDQEVTYPVDEYRFTDEELITILNEYKWS